MTPDEQPFPPVPPQDGPAGAQVGTPETAEEPEPTPEPTLEPTPERVQEPEPEPAEGAVGAGDAEELGEPTGEEDDDEAKADRP